VAFVDRWPLFGAPETTYPIFTGLIKTGLCGQETITRRCSYAQVWLYSWFRANWLHQHIHSAGSSLFPQFIIHLIISDNGNEVNTCLLCKPLFQRSVNSFKAFI